MDLVSLETPTEDELIREFLRKRDLPYIWTSGRLCNFKGCDREDLQPPVVNGWFWSGSGVKMAPTNSTPPGWTYQPWSFTGHKTQFAVPFFFANCSGITALCFFSHRLKEVDSLKDK